MRESKANKSDRFSPHKQVGDMVALKGITTYRNWLYAEHGFEDRECTNGQVGEVFLVEEKIFTCPHCKSSLLNIRWAISEDITHMMDCPLQKEKSRKRAEAVIRRSKIRVIE